MIKWLGMQGEEVQEGTVFALECEVGGAGKWGSGAKMVWRDIAQSEVECREKVGPDTRRAGRTKQPG